MDPLLLWPTIIISVWLHVLNFTLDSYYYEKTMLYKHITHWHIHYHVHDPIMFASSSKLSGVPLFNTLGLSSVIRTSSSKRIPVPCSLATKPPHSESYYYTSALEKLAKLFGMRKNFLKVGYQWTHNWGEPEQAPQMRRTCANCIYTYGTSVT